MTEIPRFTGVLIILNCKEQPKNPSQLLAVPNFIRFKTEYAYNHNLKKYKDSTCLSQFLSQICI